MGFLPCETPNHPEHARALEAVIQACHNTSTIPGIDIGAPDTVVKRIEQGFRLIPMGNDAKFVTNGAAAGLKLAKQVAAKL